MKQVRTVVTVLLLEQRVITGQFTELCLLLQQLLHN